MDIWYICRQTDRHIDTLYTNMQTYTIFFSNICNLILRDVSYILYQYTLSLQLTTLGITAHPSYISTSNATGKINKAQVTFNGAIWKIITDIKNVYSNGAFTQFSLNPCISLLAPPYNTISITRWKPNITCRSADVKTRWMYTRKVLFTEHSPFT